MVFTTHLRKSMKLKARNLSDWRERVLNRDNHTCHTCGATENIIAHHIKSRFYYPELRLRVDNGVTLCHHCHNVKKEYALRLFHIGSRSRNVVLNKILIEKTEREAERLGLSFSAFIRLLLSQYFGGIRFERKSTKTKEPAAPK